MIQPKYFLVLLAFIALQGCNQKSSGTSRRKPSATTVDCSVPNPPPECYPSNGTTTGSGDQTSTPTCQAQTTQAACGLVTGCSWNGQQCVTASAPTPTPTPTPTPSPTGELCAPLNTAVKCNAAPGCEWDGSSCKIAGLSAAPQPLRCSPLATESDCKAAIGCVWNVNNCTRPGVGLNVSFEKGDGLSVIGNTNNTLQNCNFSALFTNDGNFVLYQGTNPIWSTNTGGKGATRAQFQQDGNFVIAAGPTVLFNTATNGKAANGLALGKNGNLVILNTNNTVVWQSGTVVNGCY